MSKAVRRALLSGLNAAAIGAACLPCVARGGQPAAPTTAPVAVDVSTPGGAASAFVDAVCRGDVQAAERLCQCDRDDEPALTLSLKQQCADIRLYTAARKAFGPRGNVSWFAQGCSADEARQSAAAAKFVVEGATATSEGLQLMRDGQHWKVVPDASQLRLVLTAVKFIAAKQLVAREIESGRCPTVAAAEKVFRAKFTEMDQALGDLSGGSNVVTATSGK